MTTPDSEEEGEDAAREEVKEWDAVGAVLRVRPFLSGAACGAVCKEEYEEEEEEEEVARDVGPNSASSPESAPELESEISDRLCVCVCVCVCVSLELELESKSARERWRWGRGRFESDASESAPLVESEQLEEELASESPAPKTSRPPADSGKYKSSNT